MLDNICNGNATHFAYLMGWCARLVQHPELQGEVAVVLRGLKDTGKGVFVNALLHLIRNHGLAVSNSLHLVGRFNEHLKDCVLLSADEAFFAGDKQGEGTLKALITERVLFIEGKFKVPQQYRNRLHVIMASNSEWVVPASDDERRYFVLDVSDARAQDHAYRRPRSRANPQGCQLRRPAGDRVQYLGTLNHAREAFDPKRDWEIRFEDDE
jgi:hypothetical protein